MSERQCGGMHAEGAACMAGGEAGSSDAEQDWREDWDAEEPWRPWAAQGDSLGAPRPASMTAPLHTASAACRC